MLIYNVTLKIDRSIHDDWVQWMKADYKRYITLFSPALRLEVMDRWGNKFIAFRSLMQIVH